MQRASVAVANGECYRELPLTLRMTDGILIEGISDLVFRERVRWIVVDFKTDHELKTELKRYRHQVSIYTSAIAQAYSSKASGYLLRV